MQIAGKCSSPSKYKGMDIGNLPTSAMCTEEEIRRQEEAERRRKEEERRRQEEERRQRQEEMRKQEEERRQEEEDRQQREEEIRRQEEEKRQQEEILRQEEAKRLREEEISRQEEQRRQDEEEIRRQEEERRQSEEEIIRNETMTTTTTTTSAPLTSTIEPDISFNLETTMEPNDSRIPGTTEAPVATDPSTTVTIADATESSEGVMEGGEDNTDRNDEREHNNVVMENLNATQSKENSEEVYETEKVKSSNFTETQDSEKQDNDDPSNKMSEMDIKEIEKMITEIKGGKLKQTTNKNKDASVDNFNPDQENSISGGASDHDADTGSGTQGDDSAQKDKVKSDAMGSQKSSKAHWGKEPWVITLIVVICVMLLVGSIVGIIKAKGHLYRNNYNFNFSREYIISPEMETLY